MTDTIKYSGLQSNVFNKFIVILVETVKDLGLKPDDGGSILSPGLKSGATGM
jgi:hypothetical protein